MISSISSSNIVVKRRKFRKKRIVTRNKQKFNPNLTMRFSLFWLPKTGQRRTLTLFRLGFFGQSLTWGGGGGATAPPAV